MKTTLTLALSCALISNGCKTRDKVQVEPADESAPVLTSTVSMGEPKGAIQLLKGFYEIEQQSWRWTAGKFSLRLKPPEGAAQRGAKLVTKFALPDAVIAQVKSTTLTAAIKGTPLGSATYTTAGEKIFTVEVPASLLAVQAVNIDFALDKFLPAGSADTRELGLVISSIGLESK